MPGISKRSTLPQVTPTCAGVLKDWLRFQFHLDPYDENTIFLFCGRRCDRIKALIWEGDGFLLCYKRVDNGSFSWPRSAHEAREISADQYQALIQGLEVLARHPIKTLKAVPSVM